MVGWFWQNNSSLIPLCSHWLVYFWGFLNETDKFKFLWCLHTIVRHFLAELGWKDWLSVAIMLYLARLDLFGSFTCSSLPPKSGRSWKVNSQFSEEFASLLKMLDNILRVIVRINTSLAGKKWGRRPISPAALNWFMVCMYLSLECFQYLLFLVIFSLNVNKRFEFGYVLNNIEIGCKILWDMMVIVNKFEEKRCQLSLCSV